ncbi:MAG: hypothetical protein K9L86_01785 [Candidatus Omnitrophica bacterium]|nr:hypothetical protein [Candidatus Omnitrophota bacterium]
MKLLKVIVFCFLILGLANISYSQSTPGNDPGVLEKEITERSALIEISRLETKDPLYSIELRNASLDDFFRLLAHDYDVNILVDDRVDGIVTASFTNISLDSALNNIAKMHGLILEKDDDVIMVKPDLIDRTIVFKHIDASSFLAGEAATSLGSQSTDGASVTSSTSTSEGSGLATVYDLLSDIGQILLGKQRNLIVVTDYPENVEKVENFAKAVDGKMASRVFKLKFISSQRLATEMEDETTDADEWNLDTTQ